MRMHIHPKPVPEPPKTTTKPAGKWVELGHHQVISDHSGRVVASIYLGPPTQPAAPISVVVGTREVGRYISAAAARKAAERVLGKSDAEEQDILSELIARFQKIRDESGDD